MCRQGASAIQTSVLDDIDDPSLRVFVAWVPILPDDNEAAALESRKLMTDGRASHFWDERRALPELFNPVLGLPESWPAWDVYLAYAPGARWGEEPPEPRFWHHQLGELKLAPRLDGAAFAAELRPMLEKE